MSVKSTSPIRGVAHWSQFMEIGASSQSECPVTDRREPKSSLNFAHCPVALLGRAMSLQFSILKVLAGQPAGRATVADINRTITLLSGPEWTARMRGLSARAPDLDIFGSGYVRREDTGWQLTEAGYAFLAAIEMPAPIEEEAIARPNVIVTLAPAIHQRVEPPRLVANNRTARRRLRGKRLRENRSAVA